MSKPIRHYSYFTLPRPVYEDEPTPISKVEERFELFHLSERYVGSRVTFDLTVPEGYLDDDGYAIEDGWTPRTCFARTVKGAASGLYSGYTRDDDYAAMHLYGVNGVKYIVPYSKFDTGNKDNAYGPAFSWLTYADDHDIDPEDDEEREMLVRYCVPDGQQSGEVWVTEDTGGPVEVTYIGILVDPRHVRLRKGLRLPKRKTTKGEVHIGRKVKRKVKEL